MIRQDGDLVVVTGLGELRLFSHDTVAVCKLISIVIIFVSEKCEFI
jgi:hypothetical protein